MPSAKERAELGSRKRATDEIALDYIAALPGDRPRCCSVSTPLATVAMPAACASVITARMMLPHWVHCQAPTRVLYRSSAC